MIGIAERIRGKDATVLASRVVSLAVGPVTVVCVGLFMSPTVQGYYYSFGSVMATALLFEAGISTAIVQIAAHETAGIAMRLRGVEGSDERVGARVGAVFRFAVRWYWGVAAALLLVVTVVGWFLFSSRSDGVDWRLPWVLLVVAASVDFALQPFFVTLEGAGQVVHVYRYRLIRSALQSVVVIAAVAGGLSLFAPALGTFTAVVVGVARLLPARTLFVQLWRRGRLAAVSWVREILPFQWRIAVSWAAGYCSAALFTPVLLATRGPEEAGRMGMALSLVTACTALAASPMVANAPQFGRFAGAGEWKGLRRLFRRKARQSVAIAAVLLLCACSVVAVAQALQLPVADRVLSAGTMAVLAAGFLCYHVEGTLAFFMRAQRIEPYFLLEIVGAVVILPLTVVLCSSAGALGIAVVFASAHAFVLLPVAVVILRRNMRGVSSAAGARVTVQPSG